METPNIGLSLTAEADNPRFKDWRMSLDGDSSDSNMMKIDAAVGGLKAWQDNNDSTPLTWGMLKYGLGYIGT